MSHTTQRMEAASAHGHRGVLMAILLASAALAVAGLALLTAQPTDRVTVPVVQETPVQEADTAAVPRQREDWHGNYNMVRR